MTKTSDELVAAISKKPKKKVDRRAQLSAWIKKEVWDSRPINWLAIGLVYIAVAYTAYSAAKYYIGIPEFNGIVAFVATLAVCSRAFKK